MTEQTEREVLDQLWFDRMGTTYVSDSPDRQDRLRRFTALLDAEAYLDAALLLVPEDMTWMINTMDGYIEACVWGDGPIPNQAYVRDETPARPSRSNRSHR